MPYRINVYDEKDGILTENKESKHLLYVDQAEKVIITFEMDMFVCYLYRLFTDEAFKDKAEDLRKRLRNGDDLSDDEVKGIVNQWRAANSRIQSLWNEMNDAAITVIQMGGSVKVRNLVLSREYDNVQHLYYLTILLPSGRKLYYVSPRVGQNRWGGPSITYLGLTDKNKWDRVETYGGKLTENCVQAIARDCLAESIERLEAAGFPVVFHVHDEVIIDIKRFADDATMLKTVTEIMTRPITWAPGLPLGADGWVGEFYKKE